MNEFTDRLRAAIDERGREARRALDALGGGFRLARALLDASAAHRELLALHAPTEDRLLHRGAFCLHCASLCHSSSGDRCDDPMDAVYPCQTVVILAKAYGIEP